jgi:hypothetical protein
MVTPIVTEITRLSPHHREQSAEPASQRALVLASLIARPELQGPSTRTARDGRAAL